MARLLTLEERGDIAYHISLSHPKSDEAKKIMARRYEISPQEVGLINLQYWARWHQLIDTKFTRQLRPDESEEYRQMSKIVTKLDAKEERQADEIIAKSDEQLRKARKSVKDLDEVIKKFRS